MDAILVCIRWYAAYPLSCRNLKEMMEERGVSVDHSTVSRWAIRFLPLLKKVFRKHKHPVGRNLRINDLYQGQRCLDLCIGKINLSGDGYQYIHLLEICIFAANATEPNIKQLRIFQE